MAKQATKAPQTPKHVYAPEAGDLYVPGSVCEILLAIYEQDVGWFNARGDLDGDLLLSLIGDGLVEFASALDGVELRLTDVGGQLAAGIRAGSPVFREAPPA